jgi:hypothetical protein
MKVELLLHAKSTSSKALKNRTALSRGNISKEEGMDKSSKERKPLVSKDSRAAGQDDSDKTPALDVVGANADFPVALTPQAALPTDPAHARTGAASERGVIPTAP